MPPTVRTKDAARNPVLKGKATPTSGATSTSRATATGAASTTLDEGHVTGVASDDASLKGAVAQAKPIKPTEGKNVATDASARHDRSDAVGKDESVAPAKSAATRSVAAAFVAARQKMTPMAQAANASGKVANAADEAGEADRKAVKKTAGADTVAAPQAAAHQGGHQVGHLAKAPAPDAGAEATRLGAADKGGAPKAKAAGPTKQPFKTLEFIVYPAHGVGQIIAIEEQEVAGYKLELFVISFIKDKMILKVPLPKIASVGMRKLADGPVVKRALDTLTGRARVKRTMWSRRAQEYEAKINSGDLVSIAEVVRDLYRSDAQPEQSYSERQLYEAALDRMAREIAAVQALTDTEALKVIDGQLQKGPRRVKSDEVDETDDGDTAEGGIVEAA